jgi:hypothetical protein
MGRFFKFTGVLAATILAAGMPALASAQHGGGGHGGGGAHVGGGGHFSGGARAVGHVGGAYHYGGAYSAGFHGGYARGGYAGGHAYVRPAAGYRFYGGHPYWGGGYWRGGYWPRAYYGWGFPWFLPVLPGLYATYWWGGIPYYYANDVYYTWSPSDNGYVVTDPPPAIGNGSADAGAPAPDDGAPPPGNEGQAAPGPASGPGPAVGDVYMYPRNGQTEQQQGTDRYECHKWATAQSGFDPTRAQAGASPDSYRRAMIACLDARGYSAR